MSFEPVISRQDVSSYRSISMSYMRNIIDVVDRSGYIEFFLQKMFPFILATNLNLSFYPIKWVIECQEMSFHDISCMSYIVYRKKKP